MDETNEYQKLFVFKKAIEEWLYKNAAFLLDNTGAELASVQSSLQQPKMVPHCLRYMLQLARKVNTRSRIVYFLKRFPRYGSHSIRHILSVAQGCITARVIRLC